MRDEIRAPQGCYRNALTAILEHCRTKEAGGFTPSDFPLTAWGKVKSITGSARDEIEDVYALSPMQHGILFHSLYNPGSAVYFNQFCCRIEALDIMLSAGHGKKLWIGHRMLRTGFLWEGLEEPVQVVCEEVEFPWLEDDWRGLGPGKAGEMAEVPGCGPQTGF